MINVNWEHCWRASGVAFVVMFIIAYVIYGDQPKVGRDALGAPHGTKARRRSHRTVERSHRRRPSNDC